MISITFISTHHSAWFSGYC